MLKCIMCKQLYDFEESWNERWLLIGGSQTCSGNCYEVFAKLTTSEQYALLLAELLRLSKILNARGGG